MMRNRISEVRKSQLALLAILFIGMPAILPICTIANALDKNYFTVANHQAFILKPTNADVATPWVWYAPTFVGATPNQSTDWLFQNLLDRGVAIAGIDVGESYGNPAGRAKYSEFYDYATRQANLAAKPVLLAQSRGGLMLYNWAAENASKVGAIAGIFPVCDLSAYPGLAKAAPAYGMTSHQLELHLAEHNPIDRLQPLVQAGIPLFSIHGDNDVTVPLATNSQAVHDRYKALGGRAVLVIVPRKGHEAISAFFESPQLLNFLVDHSVMEQVGTGPTTRLNEP